MVDRQVLQVLIHCLLCEQCPRVLLLMCVMCVDELLMCR